MLLTMAELPLATLHPGTGQAMKLCQLVCDRIETAAVKDARTAQKLNLRRSIVLNSKVRQSTAQIIMPGSMVRVPPFPPIKAQSLSLQAPVVRMALRATSHSDL
jgi:hypothetical protein